MQNIAFASSPISCRFPDSAMSRSHADYRGIGSRQHVSGVYFSICLISMRPTGSRLASTASGYRAGGRPSWGSIPATPLGFTDFAVLYASKPCRFCQA
jgi:hypothetical protein